MIGGAVVRELTERGHFVIRLVRSKPNRERGDVVWDPVSGKIERAGLADLDAVVHLAGESILGLWTSKKRERMHRSRVTATEYLAEAVAGMASPPKVFACASAIGIYGSRGDAWINEQSEPGAGYLAQLAREWEGAAGVLKTAGVRVVNLRIGIVLSTQGGALASMLPPFKLGLGGPLGTGRHYMSWITLHDVVQAIVFSLEHATLSGPVNLTAPHPVTNREFTQTLGRVLHRPAIFPVPSFLLHLLPGNMGEEVFLQSLRVDPAALTRAGFKFKHPELEHALTDVLSA